MKRTLPKRMPRYQNTNVMHLLSLGAGVQSSTLALMAAHGEITPMPHAAIFADTQQEPAEVYEWLDWLEAQLPFPVYRVTNGDLAADAKVVHHRKKDGASYMTARIPMFTENGGPLGRQCTRDFKIVPIRRKVKELLSLKPSGRWPTELAVIQWLGISLDEIQRMKMQVEPWQDFRHPLIELKMTRDDCLRWMARNNYPQPPRSACTFCPFHSDKEWTRLPGNEFQAAVEFERQVHAIYDKVERKPGGGKPFLHTQRVPLDQVNFKEAQDDPDRLTFLDECAGMCGV